MTRWLAAGVAGVALLVVLLAGCGNLGMEDRVTEQGKTAERLWKIFFVVAVVIGLTVYGLIAFVVLRYRTRRRQEAGIPSQRQNMLNLEIFYTLVPLLIVGVLLGLSIRGESEVNALAKEPDLTVEVIGFQWQWQFRYPASGVVVTGVPDQPPPELVLPIGQTVRLKLVSNDVIHSFWVPQFLYKRDLIPRVDNEFDVKVTEPGVWDGFCSEFCGLDHTAMRFTVRALAPEEFETWIDGGGQPIADSGEGEGVT